MKPPGALRPATITTLATAIALLLAAFAPSVTASVTPAGGMVPASDPWARLAQQDARLLRVGDRFARISSSFCPDAGTLGFSVGTIEDIAPAQRASARAAYDVPVGAVFITAIAADGAAERAGLQVGSTIARIGTVDVAGLPIEEIWAVIKAASVRPLVAITSADGTVARLTPIAACPFQFVVDTNTKLAAGADGARIRVTDALMNFAASDEELAAIIAHEAAHFVLCHHLRRQSRRAREREADRLSVTLMRAAGYDLSGARAFWSKYRKTRGIANLFNWTHGSVGTRMKRIEKAAAELEKRGVASSLAEHAGRGSCHSASTG